MIRSTRAGRSLALATLVLFGALAACGGENEAEDAAKTAGPLPPGFTAIAADARLQPPQRTANCYASPTRIVFRNQVAWEQFWSDDQRGCPAPPLPAGVDFSRHMLVFAAMGKRMSEQDRISIDATSTRPDTLLIFVRRNMQQSGCAGREATFPQSLVKLPADTRYVKFSEEHRRIPCGS